MREQHLAQVGEQVGLVVAEVGQLDDRVGGVGDGRARRDPARPTTEVAHEPVGVDLHRRVTAHQGRPQEPTLGVEQHEAVGLRRDRDGVDAQGASGVPARVDHGLPPQTRIEVTPAGTRAFVGGLPRDQEAAVVGVAYLDLGGQRRHLDAEHQCHRPLRCWLTRIAGKRP